MANSKATHKRENFGSVPNHMPTPEEIAAACLLIQQDWSDEERERRVVGCMGRYTIPEARDVARYHPSRRLSYKN